MARKTGFKLRLKVATYLLLGKVKKGVRTMAGGKCGRMEIVEIEEGTERKTQFQVGMISSTIYTWKDRVKCKNCGAECNEIQTWEWEN